MDRLVRARVLLTEAESLGVTIEDLVAAAADRPSTRDAVPTFAEYVDVVERAIGPGRTAETYRSYWRLAVTRLGDRPIDAIGSGDFDDVLADAVARAQRLRPGTDGRASRENCVAALRAVFARALKAGLIVRNPAAALEKPRRLQSRRRALDDTELQELVDAVRTTSHDPDLDLLLVRFHLESGARRAGALTVTTDVELLDHALAYARGVADAAPDVALATLRPHVARIEAPPFHQGHLGGGLKDWATAYRMIDRVDQPVIEAGLLAAELAADQGPQGLIDAQWALDQALRACEINEALIRAAMTIDARLGHREAAQNRYLALATRLARDDLEPEPETAELRAEIMSPRYRIG